MKELETYEAPELVMLGLADDLVQYNWGGPVLDFWFSPHRCGSIDGESTTMDCC